ncbi:MAG: maltose alpha-D-glucosyltransferase [Planctomycetes bacterium]|nr:maltose alpha-D-glucosyltransferase [Planctomycetota bacterium]
MNKNVSFQLDKDPHWYKKAIIYEVHVRAFYDKKGDGMGDFVGLTEKLDYLQDLGITAIWLLPFYPSPLKDDGYDISDYYSIHPDYGTLAEFKVFLREAHERGLRIITELVINHTSEQHPWFQLSRRAKPGDKWRDFYVWSNSAEKFKDARIIFKDFENSNWTWDPVANAYFWHRFYSHQPDLNYDNPLVHKEILKVLDFWLDMGVDGLRLDAVPYLYERDGTNCENLPESHDFLKNIRQHVDQKYGDRMLLAEANQWPEDAVAYFGSRKGDECHMAFHFPLMPRLFMAVRMEDRVPIVDILEQTPPIPETCQWALFLRNHDELTLEMVTDEERDYMYRTYASQKRARINLGIRRRLAPLLGNDRKKIELLNGLLLSLPGTPVLYYGDEIGMGENIYLGDRNGMRTPMQWSSDRNAGFSRANPQSLYLPIIVDPEYHYEAVNVEAQRSNPHSLLWWMKRILALRKRWKAFGLGTLEFLHPENRKILAFVRRHQEERVLVVANLSRFTQPVELDLSSFKQKVPVEIFGRTEFPRIGEQPYFLTLGPHSFSWFSIESGSPAPVKTAPTTSISGGLRTLTVPDRWETVFREKARAQLEDILQDYIKGQRWFGGKARNVKALSFEEIIPIPLGSGRALISILHVDYVQGDPEAYVLPLAFASGQEAEDLSQRHPHMVVARLLITGLNLEGLLFDACAGKEFCSVLMESISRRRNLKGLSGKLLTTHTPYMRRLRGDDSRHLEPSIGKAEQSNTAVIFGDRLILKLFRRLEEGINPDLEIGRFLTSRNFPNAPPLAGAIEYQSDKYEKMTLAVIHGLVANSKDAWEYSLDSLSRYYERVQSSPKGTQEVSQAEGSLAKLIGVEVPSWGEELIGTYAESARLLGQRTAELHLALGSAGEDMAFAPEPFTPHYQRSLYQSLRNQTTENMRLLQTSLKDLPEGTIQLAQRVASLEPEILKRFQAILGPRLTALRIRCHGDFHLGQVLYTGKDFLIIDFEGEPAHSLSERRLKRSPLRDVAGMLRSFHYAAYAALYKQVERGNVNQESLSKLEPWARLWHQVAGVIYLKAYLERAGNAAFLPRGQEELKLLLDIYVLNKAVYELGYELNNRPDWLIIPLQGILQIFEERTGT